MRWFGSTNRQIAHLLGLSEGTVKVTASQTGPS
ncbi:response regulator transcription factor [Bradyrhizobium sp. AUGA SZCCT0283]|nr:response regulator transcription factor [Bradyrhizobium sp. AUGA SZCCT0283]